VPSTRTVVRARLATLVAVGVVAALASILFLLMVAQAGRILPNTIVAGVDVGGLEPNAARRVLAPALDRAALRPLDVSAPGERIVIARAEIGLHLDVDATIEAAFARGRTRSLTSLVARYGAPLRRDHITPSGTVDEQLLQEWLGAMAGRLERAADVGDVLVDPVTLAVSIRGPQGGLAIDREVTADRLRSALFDLDVDRVSVAATTTLPTPTRVELERIAGEITTALQGPIVLHHAERRLVIEPEVLAGMLSVTTVMESGAPVPRLQVTESAVRSALLEAGRATFDRSAVDARFVTERVPPTTLATLGTVTFRPVEIEIPLVPGITSTAFLPSRTAAQIAALVREGRRIAEADLLEREPALSTAAALAGRPTHLMGTFTTFHPAATARTINIRLLADLLDDRTIAPGQEFSINGTSGPRRCEDGFVLAGTIIRGELIDTCGGGVSQFGTTTLNAAFFAGVPLLQWQPHSFSISRYPAGREATLNYPELDVRFENDTDGWIVLRTAHTPESITVSLYGVPRWESVRAEHGDFRAPTDFTEIVRETTDLRPGARRVVQAGGGGFTTTVGRVRVPLLQESDGPAPAEPAPSVERWTTVYRPQMRIVEVGAQPAPPPPIEPESAQP
jgi:hypothetical protein